MILNTTYEIKISKKNIKWLLDKGYNCKLKDIIIIKTKDLPEGSHKKISVKCDICGTEKEIMFQKYIKNINNGGFYACSSKCAQSKVKMTTNKKYDSDYYTQTEEYNISVKNTSIEKYGVDHFTQSDIVKDKTIKTNLKKYGKKSYLQTDDYHIKMKKYLGEYTNVFQMEEIKEKSRNTNLKKYGVKYFTQNPENMKIIEQLNLEKYDIKYPIMLPDVKEKIKKTNLKKYGTENVFGSKKIQMKLKKIILNKRKQTIIKNLNKNYTLLSCNNDELYEIKCDKNHIFNVDRFIFYNRTQIYKTTLCTICNPIDSHQSDKENQLYDFIKENYDGEIITSDRKILNGKELDIYLPDLNLAFEFNGVYWHNELYKDNNYHLNKTEDCLKKNIQLIHVWEDDWVYKNEIIKSIISNKLGKTKTKIYGRKTEVRKISNNLLIRDFLNNNHLQGFIGSKVKLGLYYNNELVSLMTFGKKRLFMKSKSKEEGEYELLRFCNKLNTNVIGGASKMFNYFIKTYKPLEIISYADRSHSNGNLYEKLGFDFSHKTQTNYYYVVNHKRKHRFNYRKDKLIREGYDKNMTEHEIMLSRNIHRIYDSGSLKFIWED